ncbi:hypothetical protein ACFSRY_09955 [Pontibacter locisalis]|uniref:Uncharacterized protein n=1 Tax=Pontibacter locisalis TaxID=1719035 RepID=A0ABW5IQ96_9BACT
MRKRRNINNTPEEFKQIEPSVLWTHHVKAINFDEGSCRKIYWTFRDDLGLSHCSDDEIKDRVADLYDVATVIAHITLKKMETQKI